MRTSSRFLRVQIHRRFSGSILSIATPALAALILVGPAAAQVATGTPFCFPGQGLVPACPCTPPNPPSNIGRGCDNYFQHTGGAHLTATTVTGVASVANDTLVLTSSFENNTSFTVLMQGTATSNGTIYGAGIRCVTTALNRIYLGGAGMQANGDPFCVFHRPGPADPRDVHTASLQGSNPYDIRAHAPVTLYYQAYYRDPLSWGHCPNLTAFNASQAMSIAWQP
jgi:hypothetical protein